MRKPPGLFTVLLFMAKINLQGWLARMRRL